MSSHLTDLTWLQRAEHFDRMAEQHQQAGNIRDADFARINATTMRMMAEEEGDVVPQEVYR